MLRLNFSYRVAVDLDEKEAKRIISTALARLNINNVLVEIVFVGKKRIKTLNKMFRNKDYATDVLSFPQAQIELSKLNILGSIIICPEIAKERDESIEELIKHGLLHLTGYDHETNQKKWGMVSKIVNHNL